MGNMYLPCANINYSPFGVGEVIKIQSCKWGQEDESCVPTKPA